MKSRQTFTGQGRLFEQRLSSLLNPAHKLFQLADVLPWKQLVDPEVLSTINIF
ncbi:hypothetical protein [Cardinium endosymbiont of Tipula unca]|uniref:hypothetical protein n=1 Tax=Cardinium endosymbiont of Tipula unca TaxID=3066216 RepID=UPI0030CF6A2C